ncbi:hypothetical protein KM1_036290 [Entamoeba histolytica HM-3:IMSS]|uniref:Uncharacterized protein n=1 Tax=Entamoeba histolytica HM-3:IMSS TaxID=885315 RepID=M7WXT5_ENTHI|nr:hypothetical protein KM1_036290 [Entamoeba histolytica HM-3:IMSS]
MSSTFKQNCVLNNTECRCSPFFFDGRCGFNAFVVGDNECFERCGILVCSGKGHDFRSSEASLGSRTLSDD